MEKKAIQEKFGNNLKKYRTISGKSQEELALEADISTVYLGIIERGERCPTIDTLLKISEVLKVSPSRLLDFNDNAVDDDVCSAVKYILKDVPDKDKMRLTLAFEQIVKVYQGDF
jgi:transcriptional regulator with XRE-family HTH domain